ncbi:hypothetical protein SAMN05216475_1593 [Pseudomonas synxantha]|uniref:Prophage PssSM-02 n=1 Tax=Pseudomonas synxantha TaxID=47883 RepID=A0AAX3I4Y7_9PSED|nr:hypothetical protein [Pseudomonas synxantha]KRP51509.1 prophage PssSM-02 [Pseudomonas synxantha]SDU19068.1 hypothetical protein SAMN05216475_1593 [Pseudomonas synxantha]VTQ97716.1 Uncharacterised protein [Pseudomonas synxantha]
MNTSEMNDQQVAGLAAAICATAEAMGQEMNPGTAAMMAEDLCAYPVPAVKAALKACRFEVKGKLAMADILQRVQASDGRPGKDEAWAIAMTTNDEFETVVLTDEIQLALAAAKPVLDAGDKIGARMAFISAYERFVGQARQDTKPVNWHVSVGFDAGRRIQAVTKALELKRIPSEHGQKYLADLSVEPITEDGRALAGLITGAVTRPAPALREKLQMVKDSMLEMRAASAERKDEMRIDAANELADRRALLLKQARDLEQERASQ